MEKLQHQGGARVTKPAPPSPVAAAYFMSLFCVRPNSQTLKFHFPVIPHQLNVRSLRSLGFPKSPPLKILDPPMQHIDFNEDTANESASVAYSNVRL